MLGKIFAILVITSFVFAGFSGNIENLGNSVIIGADDAVHLTGSMLGTMCLWSGIIRVLDKAGFTALLSKVISPLLKLVYPNAYRKSTAINDIAADYSANLLGLGNAALPIGIRAMKSLKKSGNIPPDTASSEMITFAVLNTVPIQLIPTTLISIRSAHNSFNPQEIILPIWICSIFTTAFGIILCRALAKVCK